jgi:hypothetical protein
MSRHVLKKSYLAARGYHPGAIHWVIRERQNEQQGISRSGRALAMPFLVQALFRGLPYLPEHRFSLIV